MQRFFCDNCGTEVDKNESRCPKCGRYFRSVKCPECGMTGNPGLFENGCPSCGYAEEKLREEIDFYYLEDEKKGRFGGRKHKSERNPLSDLFYKRIIPVLLILMIILVVILFRSGW